ncbi:Aryl hydrocarbon receptor [Oryzias melastigma]|uniref:Aryl hydrocarbon receptor n=1 Tax=Oryzias melastigma TaxID=30732 RepID=A0A834BSL2_ORYME|nr:Aryl hydrocarbon receptor [Oryzias melastigma]
MYAGRKRRKPAQKGAKPPPAEGAKSNPSKRHRDRLNSELDRLASLLPFPEDVISSLDKLSILRLSVSYLRTKSFFSVALKNQPPNGVNHQDGGFKAAAADSQIPEGELLLQALNGFVLVVTSEGIIFFCSHTILDYLGFHQTDVMHQSVFELIHTEDQQEFRRNLHWALNPPVSAGPPIDPAGGDLASGSSPCPVSYNPEQLPPENSSFLERAFVCRFRCLLDNSSGFLPLNIQGRLKFLHGQSRQPSDSERGSPPQLALFAIATPLLPPAILEIRTKNMIFRTKHKLDFTPMACDAKGKIVLGYTEAELRVRGSGYQFIHAADMLYCAENHVRMIKTGESGLTVFRLLTKENRWKWVQANARLVYKSGKPDYIIATQRPLAEEEGGEHLRKRSMHLPFTFATGEALLYQTAHPLLGFPDPCQDKAKGGKPKKSKVGGGSSSSEELNPKSLLEVLMSQDESVYVCQPDPEPKTSISALCGSSDGLDGLLSSSWNPAPNGEAAAACDGKPCFDPLLATLDSLSLDGREACSNSELFSALENLGLNAEDLELLLLDERMIQVELDPAHIPTLTDFLSNDEILSYIQDCLENSGPGEGQESRGGSQQPAAAPPIMQLSQQMQQHIKGPPGDPVGVPHAAWLENHHHHGNHVHQLNGQQPPLHPLLEPAQHWNLHPGAGTAQLGFQNPLQLPVNGSCVPNGHAVFPPNVELVHPDYSAASSFTAPDPCGHQNPAAWNYQLQDQNRSPAAELEQLLALADPQLGLPPAEAYGTFDATPHRKVENGCLHGAANGAYVRTCLLPNANGAAPCDLGVSCSDPRPALHDPQKSGFFL